MPKREEKEKEKKDEFPNPIQNKFCKTSEEERANLRIRMNKQAVEYIYIFHVKP